MRSTQVFVYDMAHPEDVAGLARDLAEGRLRREQIRAVFAKTEGNGLDNDWSRPLALRALAPLLPAADGRCPPMVVVSGGCEGMLTPHMAVLATGEAGPQVPDTGPALAVGSFLGGPLRAEELGRAPHGQLARQAVLAACEDAGLAPDEVVSVQILSPWMGRDLLAAAAPGSDLVARTAHGSKPAIRAAAALGAALALGEVGADDIRWTPAGPQAQRRAQRVAVTAGDTGGRLHALVLGQARGWRGALRVAGSQLADMLDTAAIARAYAGPHAGPDAGRLRAAFFKGDPPADGLLRGARTTMGADSDIHAFRHFRAAMSGVFGATLGSPRVFIGGGAECQSAAGGGLLTTIVEAAGPSTP